MAVSVEELIKNKAKIEANKAALYDLTTSIGVVTVKTPSKALMVETLERDGEEQAKYLVYNSVTAPNLKDSGLIKAYECTEPFDIVDKLFKPGEISTMGVKLMSFAGFNQNIEAVLHEEVKN